MTPHPHDDLNLRFDQHLDPVLREAANPEPTLSLEARIKLALEQESRTQGVSMNAQSQTFPNRSVLWGTQTINAGWNPRGLLGAALVHALLILLIAFLVARRVGMLAPPHVEEVTLVEPAPPLPKALPKAITMGGGGGQKGPTPVTKGTPPKFAAEQLNPPKVQPLEQPKIDVPVTVDVQQDLKMARSDVPQIGVANSPLVGLSMGNGKGTGLGSGNGAGIGPGTGGNTGGGLRRIGGGVLAPVVLFAPEPEFSEEARKAKTAGNVLVYLQVDTEGRPEHVRILRGIGLGLDEKAVEAVRHYRFKPAMEDGHPVPVEMQVEVGFQIF